MFARDRPNNQGAGPLAEFLGEMSPLQPHNKTMNNDRDSVSFAAGGKQDSSGMSIDSTGTGTTVRAPLGEMQNTFEFGKPFGQGLQQSNKAFGGFTGFNSKPAAEPAPRFTREQPSPEPATPASITSEMRGNAAAPPPLTTLASLSKMSPPEADAVTPLTNMHASHVPLSTYSASPEAAQAPGRFVWSNILMWREPLQTLAVFLAGLGGYWLLTFAAYGAHTMTLVTAVSYLLLLDLWFNFFRFFVSHDWHKQCLWKDPQQFTPMLTKINTAALHVAKLHDAFLSAEDPFKTLKVACSLWAATWLGSYVTLYWAVLLGWVGAFTVPVTLKVLQPHLTPVMASIRARTIDRVDAFGMPRFARGLFCLSFVCVMWCVASFHQSAIAFFVACTYWRTVMKQHEIDAIRKAAEPYTASALKVGRRISTAAGDAFDRLSTAAPKSRTKSRFGKQRVD